MKKHLKILAAALLVAFAASFSVGCNTNTGAKSFVQGYYKKWIKGTMTAEESYDNYISQTSKDLLNIDRDTYIREMEENMRSQSIKYKSVEVNNVVSYNDDIYKLMVTIKASTNGVDNTITTTEYVINENGKYKFLQYGVSSKELVETSFNTRNFGMGIDVLYTGPDKIMMNMIANNPTTTAYAVGFEGNAKIVVDTENGPVEKTLDGTNIVKPVTDVKGRQDVEGVSSKVKRITVYNVYELDGKNQPKNLNNARSFVLYQGK